MDSVHKWFCMTVRLFTRRYLNLGYLFHFHGAHFGIFSKMDFPMMTPVQNVTLPIIFNNHLDEIKKWNKTFQDKTTAILPYQLHLSPLYIDKHSSLIFPMNSNVTNVWSISMKLQPHDKRHFLYWPSSSSSMK